MQYSECRRPKTMTLFSGEGELASGLKGHFGYWTGELYTNVPGRPSIANLCALIASFMAQYRWRRAQAITREAVLHPVLITFLGLAVGSSS